MPFFNSLCPGDAKWVVDLVNIAPGDGLVPGSANQLTEPVGTHH